MGRMAGHSPPTWVPSLGLTGHWEHRLHSPPLASQEETWGGPGEARSSSHGWSTHCASQHPALHGLV